MVPRVMRRRASEVRDDLHWIGSATGLCIYAYWWQGDGFKNFGDQLTPYLLEKLSHRPVVRATRKAKRPYIAAVGSILEHVREPATIWGSGIIRRDSVLKRPRRITAVRGPATRERLLELGYETPAVFGDPALLLPYIYQPRPRERMPVGIVPYCFDFEEVRREAPPGVPVIDVKRPVEEVIDAICSCRRIISSSLHGVIVAHAYGIPAVQAVFSDRVYGDGVKYEDYFRSVAIVDARQARLIGGIPAEAGLSDLVDEFAREPHIDVRPLLAAAPFRVRGALAARVASAERMPIPLPADTRKSAAALRSVHG